MSVRGYSREVPALTPRMRVVLAAAAHGSTTRQTAAELGVSVHTVHAIRAAAMARLGAPTITAAVWQARAEL